MNQPTKSRFAAIDAIRGFSLFGILIVNMLSFHSPHFMYGGKRPFYESMEANGSPIDSNLLLTVIDILFQASFYPLFSLLFGIGLWMMYEKRDSVQGKRILVRRLLILMGIGLLHGIFIFYGDILFTYSIVGLLTLLFLKVTSRKLLIWAVSLLVVPTAFFTFAAYSVRDQLKGSSQQQITLATEAYRGNFNEIFQRNLSDWLVMVDPFQLLFSVVAILPMFLFGIMIARLQLFTKLTERRGMIRKIIWLTFIIATIFKAGPYLLENKMWLNFAQDTIGGSASAIFYFFALLLLFSSFKSSSILERLLSSMGRLSLTNYISQSVLGFWIFYGVGLNLYRTRTIGELLIFTLVIYVGQLVVSYFYMKKFQIGPLEWLYRSLTYKKKVAFKKK